MHGSIAILWQISHTSHNMLRYCAVCRPHAYRDSTISASVGRRVAGYVIPVIIFSALLNIPRFFETELVT